MDARPHPTTTRRVGRNSFAFHGDPTEFFGPVRRRKRQLSKSPAATFELANKSFASDGHSRLPAFPPAYAGAWLVRRTNGSGLLWTTATRAPARVHVMLRPAGAVLTRVSSSSVRIMCENEYIFRSVRANTKWECMTKQQRSLVYVEREIDTHTRGQTCSIRERTSAFRSIILGF
jgi:hypothetical protein